MPLALPAPHNHEQLQPHGSGDGSGRYTLHMQGSALLAEQRLGTASSSAAHADTRVTPLLMLSLCAMMGCVFLVGMAQGDAFLQVLGVSGQFPGLSQEVRYVKPFCWEADPRSMLYSIALLFFGLGGMLGVAVSHRWGRQVALWIGLAMYAAARVLQLTLTSLAQYFVSLYVQHLSIGLLFQAALLGVLETAPSGRRGTLLAGLFLMEGIGHMSGSVRGFGLIQAGVDWAWRTIPAYALSITLLLMVLLVYLPETPASLVQRGKLQEARQALQQMRGLLADVDAELNQIIKARESDKSKLQTQWAVYTRQREALVALLFSLLLFSTLTVPTYLLGEDLMSMIAMELFRRAPFVTAQKMPASLSLSLSVVGVSHNVERGAMLRANLSVLVLHGTAYVIGSAIAPFVAETRLGRRGGGTLGMLGAMAASLTAAVLLRPYPAQPLRLEVVWATTAVISVATACKRVGDVLLMVWMVEVQPLAARSLSIGLLVACYGVELAVLQWAGFSMLCSMQAWGVYVFAAACTATTAALAWFLCFETAGVPTECISGLWARQWMWRRVFARHGGRARKQGRRSRAGEPYPQR